MGPSTKQKQRQKQAQQIQITQQQCLSVIQNIVECGIASICHHRNLFPSSFFVHPSISGSDETSTVAGGRGGGGMDDGSAVTQFDIDALLSAIPSTTTSRRTRGNDNSQQHSMELPSDSQVSANVSNSSSSPSNSRKSDNKIDDDESEILSPLTSSMTMTYTKSSQSQNTHALPSPSHYLTKMSTKYLTQQRLKAEALVLLHWLREGVGDAMKRGMLSRVIFGICLPAASTSGFEARKNRKTALKQRDKLLESYAFDIATNSSSNNHSSESNEDRNNQSTNLQHSKRQKRRHSRREKHQQQEQEMIQQSRVLHDTEALFRNLRVYSTSLPPFMGNDPTNATRPFPQSQKGLLSSSTPLTEFPIFSQSDAASLRSLPPLPSQRYLTLRVEFIDSIHDHLLPTALSPSSPLMISKYHYDEAMSSSSPSSVQDLSIRNEIAMSRPSDGHATTGERGLRNMIPVSIGDVIMSSEKGSEKKRRKRRGEFKDDKTDASPLGLGVRMIAFGRDDDDEDESEDYVDYDGDQNDDGDRHINNQDLSSPTTELSPKKNHNSSQGSDQEKDEESSSKKNTNTMVELSKIASNDEEILTSRISPYPKKTKSQPLFSASSPSCMIGVFQPNEYTTKDEEDEQTFLKNTKVMALPYGLVNSKKNRRYLPCRILDHRVVEPATKGENENRDNQSGADDYSKSGHSLVQGEGGRHQQGDREKEQLEYKVLFEHRKLVRLGRMKQWIPSKRVMSMDVMLRQIRDSLAMHNYDRDNLCARIRNQVAKDHMVSSGVVEAAARVCAKKKVVKDGDPPTSRDIPKQVASNYFHQQEAQKLGVKDGQQHGNKECAVDKEGTSQTTSSGPNMGQSCQRSNVKELLNQKSVDIDQRVLKKRRYCFIADPILVEF